VKRSGQWKGRTLERGRFRRMSDEIDQAESPAAAPAGAGASDEDEEPESPEELSPPLLPLEEVDAEVDSLASSFSTGRLGRP